MDSKWNSFIKVHDRNFHEKVFEIIEFESFETIKTSKGFQHKVHKRISEGIVLVTGPFYGVKHAFTTCLTHNNYEKV